MNGLSLNEAQDICQKVIDGIAGVYVGGGPLLMKLLAAGLSNGHVLFEDYPGLGKTLLAKVFTRVIGCGYGRVQFTPDLLPADIIGGKVWRPVDAVFELVKGPIFTNVLLADEINRTPPKTQAALLEAMEERCVTIDGENHFLDRPFFVLATQNPVELEGTYPLPEAQLDRFVVKLLIVPPTSQELKEILNRTTGASVPEARPIFGETETLQRIEAMKTLVRQVVVADPLQEVLVRILAALTPGNQFATEMVRTYVRFGPGPRGAQAVILSGKVLALLDRRINLAFEDIKAVLLPALRHRLILNFQAEADGVSADDIIEEVRNAK